MNEKLGAIFGRRSIRAYEDRAVPESLVTDVLEAAMAAPSAAAKDPWHFVTVRDRKALERLAPALSGGDMLLQGGLAIAVCGDLEAAHDRQLSFLLQDASAAIENLLLAAHLLGLGACWLGVHPREERIATLRALLGLPARIVPVSVIALGWPRERKDPRTRFQPGRVHREKW